MNDIIEADSLVDLLIEKIRLIASSQVIKIELSS